MKHRAIGCGVSFLFWAVTVVLPAGANPMPEPLEITEFSTSSDWVEVYGYASSLPYYPLAVNGTTVALNDSVIQAAIEGKDWSQMIYYVLDQSNTGGFDLPEAGGVIQLVCSVGTESGTPPTSVSVSYGTSGDVPAPPLGGSTYASSVTIEYQRICVSGWTSSGTSTPGLANAGIDDALPFPLALRQNVPNPFNPSTTITFSLPAAITARLDIYSANGQRVATLFDGAGAAGEHSVVWNAAGYASGIYFCRLRTTRGTATKTMLLLK